MLYVLWIVAAVLLLVWVMGISGVFTAGSAINLLLVAAVGCVMASILTRPRTI